MADRKSVLVIGIGNPYRSDDGVGPLIADQVMKMVPDQVDVRSGIKDGFSLIHLWQEYDQVYLIDAVSSGKIPGKFYRFNALTGPLPRKFFTNYSTHSIDIPDTIALAGKLQMLPKKLIIYGVEGKDFTIGQGLSEEVRKALAAVTVCIIRDLRTNDFLITV
jgi:hydrogenase maturation protease